MDATSGHQQSLRDRHHQLDKLIAEEMKRRLPDTIQLSKWKKEKLRIKEELTELV